MADVYSAIILDTDYWDGTISWAGETSEANRDTKYSTRRFTSVVAWESDRDGNSQAGDDEHGIISGVWASAETNRFAAIDWNADALILACPLTLPDGDNPARHDGIYGNIANAHRINYDDSYALTETRESNTTIDGLQLYNTGAGHGFMSESAITGLVLKNLVIRSTTGNGMKINNSSIEGKIENCLMFCLDSQGADTEGVHIISVSTLDIYNCIVYNFNDGIERDAGTVKIRNCAIFNNADDIDNAAQIDDDYNAGDDIGGANSVWWTNEATDWAANFEGYATGDFRPKNVDLPDAGIGPTSDASVPTTDIIGNARSGATCTIGVFEYQAATGTTYYQNAGQGAVALTGILIKKTSKFIGNHTLSIAGALNKKTTLITAMGDYSMDIVGTLNKKTTPVITMGSHAVNITGILAKAVVLTQDTGGHAMTITGALTSVVTFVKAVGDYAVNIVGTLLKKTSKGVGKGQVTPTGILVKKTFKDVGNGSVTSIGTLAVAIMYTQAVGGASMSIIGTLATQFIAGVGGAVKFIRRRKTFYKQ